MIQGSLSPQLGLSKGILVRVVLIEGGFADTLIFGRNSARGF